MSIEALPEENTRLGQALDEVLNGNKPPEAPEVEIEEPEVQAQAEEQPEDKPSIRTIASAAAKERADQRRADREAGRKAAESAFAKKLREFGFNSIEEVEKIRASQKPSGQNNTGEAASLRAEVQTLQSQIRGYKSQITRLEKEVSALRDELQVRAWAYEADVDPEYIESAATSLQKHYMRLDSKTAKEFDAVKWFSEDLKKRKPAIFRQALQQAQAPVINEAPANSSPPGSAPKAATASQVREQTTENPKNAMGMDQREYHEALRKRGIRHPASHV